MKIKIINPLSAEIFLENAELDLFDIDMDLLCDDEEKAQFLISNLAAFLSEIGVMDFVGENISCTVRQKEDGLLIILENEEQLNSEFMINFLDEKTLIHFCQKHNEILQQAESCELYTFKDFYFLLIASKNPIFTDDIITNNCMINKLREYGQLLSDTPLTKITDLRFP